jgi:hypothetical protein
VNNEKLDLLRAKVNSFNPFKILRIEDYEIRHSNILAWVFDPNGNHNFDEMIFKKFLLKILMKPDNDEILSDVNLVYKIQNMPLKDLIIKREYYNTDLVMLSESYKFVAFIENKILSSEHSNQLNRYYDITTSHFPGYTIIPIYLTLDGEETSNEKYFRASYNDLLEILEFAVNNYKDRTSGEILNFLNYYIAIIKEKYYMDDELKKLCKEIYAHNKDVIDMIYLMGNEIDIGEAIEKFKSKYHEIIPVSEKSNNFWFGIDSFSKARNEQTDSWGGGFPICFWFYKYYDKLKLALEVGPFEDANKRIDFLNKLEANGVKINNRAKEPGRKYTRIYTNTLAIKDWTDSEEVFEVMEKLYEKRELIQVKNKAIEAVDNTNW